MPAEGRSEFDRIRDIVRGLPAGDGVVLGADGGVQLVHVPQNAL